MNKSTMIILLCVVSTTYLSGITLAAEAEQTEIQKIRHRRQGPPPEAYAACESKSSGDEAQFVSPRGETVTGTCEQENARLVLRPDRPRGNSGGQDRGRNRGGHVPRKFYEDDSDNNSKVSRAEFSGPSNHFDRMDVNGDGYIQEDEARKGIPGRRGEITGENDDMPRNDQ